MKDQGGEDYIKHPLTVWQGVVSDGGGRYAQLSAILHDVVEDCPKFPMFRLVELGIPSQTMWSLCLLTHEVDKEMIEYDMKNGMTESEAKEHEYLQYIENMMDIDYVSRMILCGQHLADNKVAEFNRFAEAVRADAMLVKKWDLRHNSCITRVPPHMIHSGKFGKRMTKYVKAYNLITSHKSHKES